MNISDPKLAENFRAFLGRDPHPSGQDRQIYHMRSLRPDVPPFEWHPQSRKLYAVMVREGRLVGEIVAFNIETRGDAENARLIWLRGFNEGRRPDIPKTHLQL